MTSMIQLLISLEGRIFYLHAWGGLIKNKMGNKQKSQMDPWREHDTAVIAIVNVYFE
jgi:hypothetical protein